MNNFGCIAYCGMISSYSSTQPTVAPRNLFKIIGKRLRMQGFIVRDRTDDFQTFINDVSPLIKSSQIVWEETVTEGFENAPDAFVGLFDGDNLGGVEQSVFDQMTEAMLADRPKFFAFVYNSVGIPVAAGLLYPFFGILLSPMIAAAAMSLSSVSVIAKALRLRSSDLK